MESAVHHFLRLDLAHFHPVQDLRERMDRVLQVIVPLPQHAALGVTTLRGGLQLRGERAQVVEQNDEIADERFL